MGQNYNKPKTNEEKNLKDILIDELKEQLDKLVQESATMIITLLSESKTDSNGYSKINRYTLHLEYDPMQIYLSNYRIQLKFTSIALESAKIVTLLSPKDTCSDNFLEKTINKKRTIATIDNDDTDKNESSKENILNS